MGKHFGRVSEAKGHQESFSNSAFMLKAQIRHHNKQIMSKHGLVIIFWNVKIKNAENAKDRFVCKTLKPTSNPDVNAMMVKEAEDQMEDVYVASVTASCRASTEGGSGNHDDDDDE